MKIFILLFSIIFSFIASAESSISGNNNQQSLSASATINIRVVIPAFCKLLTSSKNNQLAENEISVTCNDKSMKWIQAQPTGTTIDTSPNCNQPSSVLSLSGMVIDQRFYVCNKTSDPVLVTLVVGL